MRDWQQRGTFCVIEASEEGEAYARHMMLERDRNYRDGSPYQPEDTDQPWIGMLAEMALGRFFRWQQVPFRWLRGNPLHEPDFWTPLGTVDCKASKRAIAPRLEWTCGVSTRQLYRRTDWYAFCGYVRDARAMWLMGMIEKPRFLELAVDLKAGDRVHGAYVVRAGNEITNLPIAALTPPLQWAQAARAAKDAA